MKNLFRIITLIPRLFLNFIWRLFWALFKTAIVLGIIIFGLLYYANHSDSALANRVATVIENVTNYFESNNASNLSETLSNLSTDDFTHYSGERWSTNSATVYIATTDSTLKAAYEEAISAWNATGAFTFTLTSDQNAADIIATDYSDSSSQAAGLAETQTNSLTNQITHVDVKLNTYYLLNSEYGYTYERIVNTAEHELGHAIGLDHDDSETSVMQSSGSYYGIQQVDIEAVQSLYAS